MKDLVKYEPMLEITLFSGNKKYIPLSKTSKLIEQLETKKFVQIGDYEGFASSSVDSWKPLDISDQDGDTKKKKESNIIEMSILHLPSDVRVKVRDTVAIWRAERRHKELTQGIVNNIISSITNGN